MHTQIRRVGAGLMIMMLLVFLALNRVQFFEAEAIADNPANIRSLIARYSVDRGDIITFDKKVVARSEETGGRFKFEREYPFGDLYSHVTGYDSPNFGQTGVESTFNDQLQGEGGVISIRDFNDRFLGDTERGDNVVLTIDSRLQEVARTALGDQEGAVVALDPRTGGVRAMWSNPSFDPNPLTSFDAKESTKFRRSLDPRSSRSPLVSRVAQFGYPPGSTFKVVTTTAALESGEYQPSSTFPDPQALDLPLTDDTLTNFTKTTCVGGGRIDLATALTISCDTTFAILGLNIFDQLKDTSENYGFNDDIPFDIRTEPSQFPDIPDDEEPLRAFAGIGQASVVGTPLQMALVAAGVANGGDVPRPRLVEEVTDPAGGVVERLSPETIGTAMSSDTAAEVGDMMVSVVEEGTGTAAQIPGVEVAGKTGTAQSAEGAAPHAWFICFAPADDPKLAVAVLVENGGSAGSEATGGAVAAPIAKAILEQDRELRDW
jgi:penicillin-binding protein A